ncbi:hypothetical protein [Streptomyces palmae]|uniref:Uncharacterized protein n=1 Tax=Streptomyces palmae TaxID=1701085 RepID=A0A4Z0G7C1_9ACTN|nr:hypothetical protein [Streptomyces palmae]TGA89928.1 hypothetical protein E4099_29000 [Streptomyces palmae]
MAVSMYVVWSTAEPRRVIYETHSIEAVADRAGVHAEVRSESHQTALHSRAQARSIAEAEGYELRAEGEAWESLPESLPEDEDEDEDGTPPAETTPTSG